MESIRQLPLALSVYREILKRSQRLYLEKWFGLIPFRLNGRVATLHYLVDVRRAIPA